MNARLLLVALICASAIGCSPTAQQVVARRAAFDLSCPAAQLEVQPLEEVPWRLRQPTSDWGVVGCGRRAVYHAFCARARPRRRCTVTQTETSTAGGTAEPTGDGERAP